jgi:choline kinase
LTDEKNEISCDIKFGKIKKKPTDFFAGEITRKGKAVSKFDGSYCGFLTLEKETLESDYQKRLDLQVLRDGNFEQAQIEK